MRKKIIVSLTLIIIVLITFIIIKNTSPNNKGANLEKYTLLSNETITSEFKYKSKKYILTSYYNNTNSYAYNNLLLKEDNKYFLLKSIDKCNMSFYIYNNEIYIHCIGRSGNILKYIIDENNVKEEFIKLNYEDTPNISQIHITIDKVDNKYIYLKSNVKNIESIKEGKSVKCSLSTKQCEYN